MHTQNSGRPGALGDTSERTVTAIAATRFTSLPLDDVGHSQQRLRRAGPALIRSAK